MIEIKDIIVKLESPSIHYYPTIIMVLMTALRYLFSDDLQRGWLLFGALFLIPTALVVGFLTWIVAILVRKYVLNFMIANIVLFVLNIILVFALPLIIKF